MPFKRKDFKRRPPVANTIVVEGKKREMRYFQQAAQKSPGPGYWTVQSSEAGDPKSLLARVRTAIEESDRVFVVFDGDRMPPNCSYREAKSWSRLMDLGSKSSNVHLIISHPCFEVWFLLHLTHDLPAVSIPGPAAYSDLSTLFKNRLSELMPSLDRSPRNDWEQLRSRLPAACARARKARTAKAHAPAFSDVDLLIREMGLD